MKGSRRIRFPQLRILHKLLISFLLISSLPLILVAYIANVNLRKTGEEAIRRVDQMGEQDLGSAKAIGQRAIEDSVAALQEKSTESIELRTAELADRVADFLYERDKDLLALASQRPDAEGYLNVYRVSKRDVIVHVQGSKRDVQSDAETPELFWDNPENRLSWRHRGPIGFAKERRPIYKEVTFVDLQGMEKIKVTERGIETNLKDVSRLENTYCKAEDYFARAQDLGPGQIYVSRVIGTYVPGWLAKGPQGVKVTSESAYAGKENPAGERFQGIVRWVTPVYEGDRKIGYLTMALDQTHLMEFTNHVDPTEKRFSAIPDAGSGNYGFIWDHQGRCIAHPRHFFIAGYDPETGQEVPGWMSQDTYEEYLASGLSLEEFLARLPPFREFTQQKQGSKAQMRAGRIPLHCKTLDTAPQCQGWHQGTEDGGSGSFVIQWSGLWKLTSYAAIPYFTGMYRETPRGFGYVTIGANVDDFHKAAMSTKQFIESTISEQQEAIEAAREKTRASIMEHQSRNSDILSAISAFSVIGLVVVSAIISFSITRPIKYLTDGAMAMSRGYLNQRVEAGSGDEIGRLARSFNEMAAAVAQVDRMKSEFVTIASHELRTPIHSMLLVVSGILAGYSGAVDEEVREDLGIVKEEIARLTRLVEQLLSLSRIEARRLELNMAETTVDEIVEKAVDEVANLAHARGHTVSTVLQRDLPPLEVDRDRITQVMINLLSNSIKYTPQGGKIIVKAEAAQEQVLVSVADNGYGVPAWANPRIFEKFFQADSILSQQVGGSGLGLSISKELVEQHGGEITCSSPLTPSLFPDLVLGGERLGSVFTVRLPLAGQRRGVDHEDSENTGGG